MDNGSRSASQSLEKIDFRELTELTGREKHIFSLISFIFVVILTILLYLVPDYFFLERITTDVVYQILRLYKYDVSLEHDVNKFYIDNEYGTGFFASLVKILTGLDGHKRKVPTINPNFTLEYNFAVVRACTGMQAGALLLALIIVTPAIKEKKLKSTAYVLLALVLGNFLRIALDIGMTLTLEVNYGLTHDAAWMWSHDVIGKPIGFFGTIFFAFIIEKQGVPILNTISLWIDSLIDLYIYIKTKIKKQLNKKEK